MIIDSAKTLNTEERLNALIASLGPPAYSQDFRLNNVGTGDQLITGNATVAMASASGSITAPVTVPAAGNYRVDALLTCKQGGTANTQVMNFNGSHWTSGTRIRIQMYATGTGQSMNIVETTATGAITVQNASGAAFGISAVFFIDIRGIVVTSAADTFGITANEGGGGTSWTVSQGSWMEFMPQF